MSPTEDFLQAVSDLASLLGQSPISDQVVIVHEHFDLSTDPPETGIRVVLNSTTFASLLSKLEFRGRKIFVRVGQDEKIKTQESTFFDFGDPCC